MREIKFRAWNSAQKTLAQVDELRLEQHAISVIGDKYLWDMNKCPIEQYTGVNDDKGKEVYEGDIVTLTGVHEEDYAGSFAVKYVIRMLRGSFCAVNEERKMFIRLDPHRVVPTIVGDIHHNLELPGDE